MNALLDLPEDTRWRLVHGAANGIAHAWLADTEFVFDPVLNRRFSIVDYRLDMRGIEWRIYTQKEMALEVVRHGHSGPWEEMPKQLWTRLGELAEIQSADD
ncbi:MAG: hypothetical protein ACREFP_03905 [Acetobacteraceae bacterium]